MNVKKQRTGKEYIAELNESKPVPYKIAVLFSVFAAIILYSLYLWNLCGKTAMDSDFGNLVLEAADVLNGNFLRNGWYLTGVSFLLTDIPYFCVGVLISGVSKTAYIIGIWLMDIMLMLAAQLLINAGIDTQKKNNGLLRILYNLVIYLVLMGASGLYLVDQLRAHTGSVIIGAVLIYLHSKARRCADKKKRNIIYLVSIIPVIMCFTGDGVSFIITILPLIIWFFVEIVRAFYLGKKADRSNYEGLVITCAGLVLSIVASKLYYTIGKADMPGGYVAAVSFTGLSDYPKRLESMITSLTRMYNFNYFGDKVIAVSTPFHFISALIAIIAAVVGIINIVNFIRNKKTDFIGTIISIGIFMVLAVCLMTSLWNVRYIATIPALSAVVIIRYFTGFISDNEHLTIKNPLVIAVAVVLLINAAGNYYHGFKSEPEACDQEELAAFLAENGLEHGYSGFWNSSIVTVMSNGKSQVAAMKYDSESNTITRFNWFSNAHWYYQGAYFFITVNDEDYKIYNSFGSLAYNQNFGLTEENISSLLGPAKEKLDHGVYTILIYDPETVAEVIG